MPEKFDNKTPNKSVMPLPTGQAVVAPANNPTSGRVVTDVPPEVAKLQQSIKSAPIGLPVGVNPNQTEINAERSVNLKDLPPEEQLKIMQSFSQLSNAAPTVDATTAIDPFAALNVQPQTVDPVEQPATQPETPADDNTAESAPALPQNCPCCNWNMQDKFDVKITDIDKQDFVMAVLGGKPFVSETELFGGKLKITFRTITADEEQRIEQHLLQKTRDGKITSATEWVAQANGARLAYATTRVQAPGDIAILIQRPAVQIGMQTVAQVCEEFTAQIKTEMLSHALAKQYRLFRNKVEVLEANVSSESFW